VIVVVYLPDGGKQLLSGYPPEMLAELKGEIRRLDTTELSNIGTLLDPRLPATAAEFDLKYPDAQDWK
jgi:hypothetical protein